MRETRIVTCEECGGEGAVEIRHPLYGSAYCPEPWADRECMDCDGRGVVEVAVDPIDIDDLEEQRP